MQSQSLFHLRKEVKTFLDRLLLTSKGMEDEEPLEAVGLVSQPSHTVHCYLADQTHCK